MKQSNKNYLLFLFICKHAYNSIDFRNIFSDQNDETIEIVYLIK